jgi:hypothetical protein
MPSTDKPQPPNHWTFPWLSPGGAMSCCAFADEVVSVLEKGLS